MSFETRGPERPAGAPGSATAEGVSMQILSTEHWSLLATRSLGYTEFFSRANMFFSVLSGAVIALALIAQAGRFETFIVAAMLLLAITFFVGLATIARIGQLNYEDTLWVTGMNRIRHAYLELHPELAQYFVTSQHDDMLGIFTTLGLARALPGRRFLADLGHGFTTLPGMLTIIVAVVAGAWGAVVSVAAGAPQPIVVVSGVLCFLITMVGSSIWGQRVFLSLTKGMAPQFPSPS
jgi:hypothetical protein